MEKTKTKNPLVLGSCSRDSDEGTGFTIYKNTNEDIVNKIKSIEISTDTFTEWGKKGECKIQNDLGNGQFLCVDEDGKNFVKDADSFESTNRTKLLDEINDKYNVAELMNEALGPLYINSGYGRVIFEKYDTYYKRIFPDFEEHKEELKSRMYKHGEMGRINSSEIGVHLNTWRGITLTEGEIGGSSMFCHLNEDGNFVNRDYNYDITPYLDNKLKTRKDLIEEIIDNIPDVKYKNYGNKYFSNKFAFIIDKVEEGDESEADGGKEAKTILSIRKLDHSSGDNYGDSSSGRVKKPKKVVDVNRKHILSKILPLVNEIEFGEYVDISEYIDVEDTVAKSPEKRVQKSKIKESKYDVYDWREEGHVVEEKVLMDALKNIENGIEPGDNEDIVKDIIDDMLHNGELPSFSFDKGEEQEDHSDYIGLVKLPHGCNFTFKVEEGDACEITWSHSYYETDIVEFELVQ